jgi:hypothetical protein
MQVETLPQLKEYVKQNHMKEGLFLLGLVAFPHSLPESDISYAPFVLRVSSTQHTFLTTLQGRSNGPDGTFSLQMYHMRMNFTRDLAMVSALERVTEKDFPIFSRILSPRKHRLRYNLDQLDVLQGKMEKYMKDAEKAQRLLANQATAMHQYIAFFRESFLIINGKVSSLCSLSFASLEPERPIWDSTSQR